MGAAPASGDPRTGDPAPSPVGSTAAAPEEVLEPSPQPRAWWALWRGVRFGLLTSVPLGAFIVLDELFLVGFSWLLVLPLGLGVFGSMVVIILTAPLLFFRATKEGTLELFGAAFAFTAIALAARVLHNDARMVAFARVARDAEPLVAALHAFTAREGHPPAALDELVPAYIAQVPRASYLLEDFGYRRHEGSDFSTSVGTAEPDGVAPWSLVLDCCRGAGNFDVFVYLPGERYPDSMYGGYVERVGRWAYVHE